MVAQAGASPSEVSPPYWPLPHRDRVALVTYRVAGHRTVTVAMATQLGSTSPIVAIIDSLGGVVRYRDNALGYVRARLPVAVVERVARMPAVLSIMVDLEEDHPTLEDASAAPLTASVSHRNSARQDRWHTDTPIPPPDATTPAANPYMPVQDLGAPQFIASHPTYDGRGATIAIVEAWGDISHPTIQDARRSDGTRVRKVAAMDVPGPDLPGTRVGVPSDTAPTPDFRVIMHDSVIVRHGRFVVAGVSYRAPHDGTFRFGRKRRGPRGIYAVRDVALLWDSSRGELWFDALGTGDFTAAPPLHDFNATGEYGWLGTDDLATPWDDRPTIFVVLHPTYGAVDCFVGGDGHTMGVSAVAAGSHIYSGSATGVAPSAQLVWVSYYGGYTARLEAFIRAARRPDVDVVANQQTLEARLRDNQSVFSIIMRRLAAETGKLVFKGETNLPPLMTSLDASASADGLLGVSGYVSRATWHVLYGVQTSRAGTIPGRAGSAGPASDGDLTPFGLAPAAYLAPGTLRSTWRDRSRTGNNPTHGRGLYPIPVGYALGIGTSFATPGAAGVAALLVSAAKQAHRPYDGPRLRLAMAAGAVPVPNEPYYRQGHGLLNVERAWVALQKLATEPSVSIESSGPVRTVLTHELATPGIGRGLFEREGWRPGDMATRVVTLTRMTGPVGTQPYRLAWKGNDGTYQSDVSVMLPLRTSVAVPVHVAPRTAGAHSALLDVLDDRNMAIHTLMATVVAADTLVPVASGDRGSAAPQTSAHTLANTFTLHAPWLKIDTRFVVIPAGLDSMVVTLATGPRDDIMELVFGPAGYDNPYQAGPEHTNSPHAVSELAYSIQAFRRRAIGLPEPGVWELGVANTNDSLQFNRAQPMVNATLTVTAYARGVKPAGGRTSYRFAPNDTTAWQTIHVGSHTRRLDVRLERPSTPDADIDIYLADCTKRPCRVRTLSTIRGAEKAIAVERPAPGLWKIGLDPVQVPPGGVTVDCVVRRQLGGSAL